MTRRKLTADQPLTLDAATGQPLPTPRPPGAPINLHDLEAIRREMARVYRDMRACKLETQEGTRLVYVLGQMAKVHEIAVLEKKVNELEKLTHEPR